MAVPLDTPSTPQSRRALRNLEAERKRDEDERISGWAVVWTLFAFKMATICIVWYVARGAPEANAYITVTTWYWMSIPAVAISGFVAYRWRLRKTRKRVEQLRQAEFMDEVAEPFVITDEDVRRLMAQESPRHGNDRPGEG